ncbi:hypothetical protein GM418_18385 [Maribellus comscasis]|uniref:Uncharacterized protein n=1 Tax=Maribellus comscasis TaxID=2681766 RepID=A0A6I6JRI3_9BACT|nr:hypothetical protein [Maribellus comscasis]QGY45566.1 hypothetical protein GM418_18385 [Maribellus comscasis]
MKTKNNVQKAITKTLAAGMSLVLISITVNAQDFWRSLFENSSFNTIATAMVDNNPKAMKTETHASSAADFSAIYTETEEALELENWMTDEGSFESTFNFENEVEAPLNLEDWMTSTNSFNKTSFAMEVEVEEALELENWMIDETNFENSSIEFIKETEKPLELENWMLEEYNFDTIETEEQPLELESWMISDKNWVA